MSSTKTISQRFLKSANARQHPQASPVLPPAPLSSPITKPSRPTKGMIKTLKQAHYHAHNTSKQSWVRVIKPEYNTNIFSLRGDNLKVVAAAARERYSGIIHNKFAIEEANAACDDLILDRCEESTVGFKHVAALGREDGTACLYRVRCSVEEYDEDDLKEAWAGFDESSKRLALAASLERYTKPMYHEGEIPAISLMA